MSLSETSRATVEPATPEWLRASDSRLRLHTIVRLRWLAVVGQSLTVLVVHWVLGMSVPIGWCFTVIALSAWLNVALRIRFPESQRLTSRSAFLMLGFDIIQLAALLYLTGGLKNPFAFLLVAPVAVSASALPLRTTLALGFLAILAASLLAYTHLPLPWCQHDHATAAMFHHPVAWCHSQTIAIPQLYLVGVWAAVVLGIGFIGFYTWRTAQENRRMAEALTATEMVLAREQRLSALDGMAAAAAHGLGTPLATIAVATKELLNEAEEGDPIYDDLVLVRHQAERCRDILKELSARAEELDTILSRLPVSHLIDEVVDPYRPLGVPIAVTAGPKQGLYAKSSAVREPVTDRNPGVLYGLGNLIENALDFAKEQVSVDATWSRDEVRIVVTDDGDGFPPDVLEQLGEPFVTTRPASTVDHDELSHAGMGLGFFIAKTLLERSYARLELSNRSEPQTGAIVTVIWPRKAFETPQRCDRVGAAY
ncbi:MAG: ActS/PrrB/RegB family redox-sensitive histidine kinase [Methyloceanibacter sp.]|nr:ActS/PrrB/RegB family redox-sensitive histidine kinase [Methyloceanibacter sp.]